MGKIALIAPGEDIARFGYQLKKKLPYPDNFIIIKAHMEDAVIAAHKLIESENIDVLISRGTTGRLIEQAQLGIPCTMIPIGEQEILECLKEARKITGLKNPHIGFLDFDNYITPLIPFLSALNITVSEYRPNGSDEIIDLILQSKKDHCDILIGGRFCFDEAHKRQIPAAFMGTSLDSMYLAYQQAIQLQQAVNTEKQKIQEQKTILDTVTDAIISVTVNGNINLINQKAEFILQKSANDVIGKNISSFLTKEEFQELNTVLQTGEESLGKVWCRSKSNYAVHIVPIWTSEHVSGALISLLEVKKLQTIETNVRMDLHKKGNVAYYTFHDILGDSPQIQEAISISRSFAPMQSNVLIIGETGTGKELFAQSIHNASTRASGPFIAVNCGAIPAELVESELFGYDSGAFTGAKKGGKPGLFESAHNGTIFLDEISEMSLNAQVKLLRVIQERQIRRIGSDNTIPIDVRIIAACNVNLYDQVRKGEFRQDLYYRLSILVVNLPPLRQREGDTALLATRFLHNYNRQFGHEKVLSEAACHELERYNWEGNIRQLRNFCERLAAISPYPVIDASFVRKQYKDSFGFSDIPHTPHQTLPTAIPITSTKSVTEGNQVMIKGHLYTTNDILSLLASCQGNRSKLAQNLGISRTTLWKYLQLLGI